jgi:exonuclease III
VDSFRLHEKGAGHFSWWDYRTGYDNNQGMRIDQVWISKGLEKQCTGARIDIGPRKLEKPSDHTPCFANSTPDVLDMGLNQREKRRVAALAAHSRRLP